MHPYLKLIIALVAWFFLCIIPAFVILSSSSMLFMKSWFDLYLFFPLLFFIGLYITFMRLFNVVIRGFRFFDPSQIKYFIIAGSLGALVGAYYYLNNVVYTSDIGMLWDKIIAESFAVSPMRSLLIIFLYLIIITYYMVAIAFRGTDFNKLIPRVNLKAPIEKILAYYS